VQRSKNKSRERFISCRKKESVGTGEAQRSLYIFIQDSTLRVGTLPIRRKDGRHALGILVMGPLFERLKWWTGMPLGIAQLSLQSFGFEDVFTEDPPLATRCLPCLVAIRCSLCYSGHGWG
jgi:hypothetical protein